MKIKVVLLLLSGLLFLFSSMINGAFHRPDPFPVVENASVYPDPIARLNLSGRASSRLATPVGLPFKRTLPGPVSDWLLMTADGRWSNEYVLNIQAIDPKGFRYEQRSGRACQGLKPWWILANRRTGQGMALMLAFMGNWTFEAVPRGRNLVVRLDTAPSGLKPFATIQGLPIPGALMADFTGHWDYGAQSIKNFIREKLLRDLGGSWPLVQYNTYYENYEFVTERQVLRETEVAADAGCELFTVDASWFGKGRGQWSEDLGDWEVNKDRFPDGMEGVANEVRRRGMKFGLWFELECAHPTSRLAAEHPNWFLVDARGKRIGERDVLDLGKPEVFAYAQGIIDEYMARLRLDYIKMDFNIDPAIQNEALAPAADPLYRHYRGLARLWAWMRGKYPDLIIENCSSGSLRQELTAVASTDTHWVSDRVDNQPNLMMMMGATYLFPPSVCSHWTARPDRKDPYLDLDAQFAINMMGHMGLSGAISKWDDKTLALAKARIEQYKRIRPIIREAQVFHLTDQRSGSIQAALYSDRPNGRALLFAFQGGDTEMQRIIKLRGLDLRRRYRVIRLPGANETVDAASLSEGWMVRGHDLVNNGLKIAFPNTGAARIYEFQAEDPPRFASAR